MPQRARRPAVRTVLVILLVLASGCVGAAGPKKLAAVSGSTEHHDALSPSENELRLASARNETPPENWSGSDAAWPAPDDATGKGFPTCPVWLAHSGYHPIKPPVNRSAVLVVEAAESAGELTVNINGRADGKWSEIASAHGKSPLRIVVPPSKFVDVERPQIGIWPCGAVQTQVAWSARLSWEATPQP